MLTLSATPAIAETITGPARVIDGETLEVAGARVRFHALHVPELGEPGGSEARDMAALATWGEILECDVVEVDADDRLVADCRMLSDGADLAEVMIRSGRGDHCPAFGRPDLADIPPNGFELPSYC